MFEENVDYTELGEKAGRFITLSMARMRNRQSKSLSELSLLCNIYYSNPDFKNLVEGVANGIGLTVVGCLREGLVLLPQSSGLLCSRMEINPKGGWNTTEDAKGNRKASFRMKYGLICLFICAIFYPNGGSGNKIGGFSQIYIMNALKNFLRKFIESSENIYEADLLARDLYQMGDMKIIESKNDSVIDMADNATNATLAGLIDTVMNKMKIYGLLNYNGMDDMWYATEYLPAIAAYICKKMSLFVERAENSTEA